MFDVREEDDLFMLLFVLFVGVTPNEDGEEDTFELLAGEAIIDGLAARLLPSPRTRTLLLLLAFTASAASNIPEISGWGPLSSSKFSSSSPRRCCSLRKKKKKKKQIFFFFTEEEG